MNILSSFSDFYNNLTSNGLFFFWIVVFLFVFLIFLVVSLKVKNNKLRRLLKEEVNDNKEEIIVEENVILEDVIPVVETVIEVEEKIVEEEAVEPIKAEVSEEIKEEAPVRENDNGLYKKNVLRDMNRMQTSPIHIDRKEEVKEEDLTYGGLVTMEDSPSNGLDDLPDLYEANESTDFMDKALQEMQDSSGPSNIELTDYEKKQEEEAIISYDELLKVKDKIYNITEDEETDEFIDELKNFRLDL